MSFRILIENKTQWAARDLRRFVVRAARRVLHDQYRETHPRIRIRFAHRHTGGGGSCSGHAYLNGSFAHISIPKDYIDRIDLAHVIAHEFGHLTGLEHRDMTGGALWHRVGNWRELYAWAEELPLTRKLPKPKPTKKEKRDAKQLRLAMRLRKWESRAKRAATAIKKLRRQLARMEKEPEVQS